MIAVEKSKLKVYAFVEKNKHNRFSFEGPLVRTPGEIDFDSVIEKIDKAVLSSGKCPKIKLHGTFAFILLSVNSWIRISKKNDE